LYHFRPCYGKENKENLEEIRATLCFSYLIVYILVNVLFLHLIDFTLSVNYVSLTSFSIASNTSSSLLAPHSVKKGILERPKCQHHYQDVLASFVKPCVQF
jgi:hypothetical protein